MPNGHLRKWRDANGLAALWDYTRSVLFIHDDSIPELLDAQDVTSYHPLLIQPDGIVVPDGELLGGRFGEYLSNHIRLPSRIYSAHSPSISALRNVLLGALSPRQINEINECCDSTSVFHSDRADVQRNFNFIPPILETQSADAVNLQNRINARKALTKARIPTPKGREVESYLELIAFCQAYDFPVAIRTKKSTTFVRDESECLRQFGQESDFPIWVERWCPTLYSPNAQVIVRGKECFDLFVSRQILKSTTYQGNCIGDIPQRVVSRCLELTRKFADSLCDYNGIIGIDFIVTTDESILAVDVNARFNSSTIPYWWLLTANATESATVASLVQTSAASIELNALATTQSSRRAKQSELLFSPITNVERGRAVGYHKLMWR